MRQQGCLGPEFQEASALALRTGACLKFTPLAPCLTSSLPCAAILKSSKTAHWTGSSHVSFGASVSLTEIDWARRWHWEGGSHIGFHYSFFSFQSTVIQMAATSRGPRVTPSLYQISASLKNPPTALGSHFLVGLSQGISVERLTASILRQTRWNIPSKLELKLDLIFRSSGTCLFPLGDLLIFKRSAANVFSTFSTTPISLTGWVPHRNFIV